MVCARLTGDVSRMYYLPLSYLPWDTIWQTPTALLQVLRKWMDWKYMYLPPAIKMWPPQLCIITAALRISFSEEDSFCPSQLHPGSTSLPNFGLARVTSHHTHLFSVVRKHYHLKFHFGLKVLKKSMFPLIWTQYPHVPCAFPSPVFHCVSLTINCPPHLLCIGPISSPLPPEPINSFPTWAELAEPCHMFVGFVFKHFSASVLIVHILQPLLL